MDLMGKKPKTPVLKVDDLNKEFQAGFSDALKERFKEAAYNMVVEYDEAGPIKDHSGPNDNAECEWTRKLAIVKSIGCRTDVKYKVNSVKKVVEILEDLESRGYIRSFLAPLCGILMIEKQYAVVSYPALYDEGITYLEETYPDFNMEEGDTPVSLEELNALPKE